MGSTGAVIYARPQVTGAQRAAGTTGAVLFVPMRGVAGIFSNSAFAPFTSKTPITGKPNARVPLTDSSGRITPEWDRFLQYVFEEKLGGVSAPTISEVQSTVGAVQTAVTSNVTTITVLADVVNANASAQQTATQVAQQNNLSGATQIPPAQQFKRDSNE